MKWAILAVYVITVILFNWFFLADRAGDKRMNKRRADERGYKPKRIPSIASTMFWSTIAALVVASIIGWGLLPGLAMLKFIFS